MSFIFTPSMQAQQTSPDGAHQSPARVINLIDYIGTDYRGAVPAPGQVKNPDEYQEMLDFCTAAIAATGQLQPPAGPGVLEALQADLRELQRQVEAKAHPDEIARRASDLKGRFIQSFGVPTWPRRSPDPARGRELYQARCTGCHGIDGRADTPTARTLVPPPRSFVDPEIMGGLSPFKAYNVISFGVDGTGMRGYPDLSEQERWDVAFEVFRMRFSPDQVQAGAGRLPKELMQEISRVQTLSTSSDDELLARLATVPGLTQESERLSVLAFLRSGEAGGGGNAAIAAALQHLRRSMEDYQRGDTAGAYQAAVDSYLEGFENAESSLGAIDRAAVSDLEKRYGAYRDSIRLSHSSDEVIALGNQVELKLREASQMLEGGKVSGGLAFLQAFAIIAREGLEAAFLIAALLAFLGKSGHAAAKRYIHLGTGSALLAGFATWWATFSLIRISGAQRELLEGITSTLAAVILFYVSYWLFSKSEAAKWMAFLKEKVQKNLSGGNLLALTLLAFLAVYREAFETVLFYHALFLSAGEHTGMVWAGLGVGTATLLVLIVGIFRMGLKLPLQKFFRVTSALMYLLCFVLAGHGLRELQLAGVISYTPLPLPDFPLLGIYSALEPLLAQGLILAALAGYLVYLAVQRGTSPTATPGSSAA